MNEKIDLTKILKDCPEGMELDCTMYDNVTLKSVSNDIDNTYPICIKTKCGYSTKLTKYGQNVHLNDAKCVIFPKGKTTWKGFQRPFVDGDIITYMFYGKPTTYIYRENGTHNTSYYAAYSSEINKFYSDVIGSLSGNRTDLRFATEEEKQKLFDTIKANGYEWNAETKTLEKVLEENKTFKNGDIIVSTFGNIAIFSHTKKNSTGQNIVYYHCLYSNEPIYKFKACIDCGIGYIEDCRLATEYEKKLMMNAIRESGFQWNTEKKTLEKLIVPKFKVGNTIQSKNDNNYKFIITNIDNDGFYHGCGKNGRGEMCEFMIPVVKQDNWELIPNKFDPKTLKPFDKVLVRDNFENTWYVTFFSHIDDLKSFFYKFVTTAGKSYKYVIPYNEETKHLLGTNKQAPEFYIN